MKTILLLTLCLAVGGTSVAVASPNYSAIGAALGTASGFVLANNVDGVSRNVAVPVLAVLGGVIGNQVNQKMKDYHHPHHAVKTIYVKPAQPFTMPDPQPGVDLIKVSILNSNGVRTDVPILRIKNKFIGPQGETYDSLPTSEALAKKYGM